MSPRDADWAQWHLFWGLTFDASISGKTLKCQWQKWKSRSANAGDWFPPVSWKANWPARQNRCLMMENTKTKCLFFCSWHPSWERHQAGCGGSVQGRVQGSRPGGQMDQWWVIHSSDCTCWNPERPCWFLQPLMECCTEKDEKHMRVQGVPCRWGSRFCPDEFGIGSGDIYRFLVTDETSIGLVVFLFLQMTKSAQMFWTHCLNNSATLLCCLLLYIQQICTKTQQESYLTQTTFRGVVLVLKQSKQQRCFCSAAEGWRLPPPPLRLCDGGSEQTVHFWTKLPCFNPALLCMCLCKCRHLDLFCLSLFTLYWFLICQKGIIC